jgi:retron-type reverse transcriptase
MKELEERIEDQRFLELVRKALKAGYLDNKVVKADIIGTPQGSIISPILANIYLHKLDLYIESLKKEFDAPKKSHTPRNKESLK